MKKIMTHSITADKHEVCNGRGKRYRSHGRGSADFLEARLTRFFRENLK